MVSTIENLPDDILLNVFEYLDCKSLKNSALVCKTWNDVISGSTKLAKNFTLNLFDSCRWVDKFEEIINIKLKIQSMRVTLHTYNILTTHDESKTNNAVELLVQLSRQLGCNLKKFVLNNVKFQSVEELHEILSNMPLLVELKMTRVKFHSEEVFTKEKPVILSNLNKFEMDNCDWNVFALFIKTPIKELSICHDFPMTGEQHDTYNRFLEGSHKLESIELDITSYSETFQAQIDDKISFHLKRLLVSYDSGHKTKDVDKNFSSFLESQASSLKELDLRCLLTTGMKTILSKLQNLEKLRVHAVLLPCDNEFYRSLKRMSNLLEFTLYGNITTGVGVKEILSRCSNLEELNIYCDPGQHISNLFPNISICCPKINRMSLYGILVPVPDDVKFHHLKYLDIQLCNQFDYLVAFLNNNTVVETLTLNLFKMTDVSVDATLDALLNQTNVLHLKVTADFFNSKRICNKITQGSNKLKSFEMRVTLGVSAIKELVSIVRNDQLEWQRKN